VTQLWGLAPYSKPWLDTNSLPNVRCLAYNPVSRHLLVASRNGPHVYVLNADTTADLNELNVSGVSGGTYALLMVGVADDGVVYAGNLTTGGTTTAFKLYRWANDSAATIPTVAYTGDPGNGNNQRWGDTFDVRGAGANTQIIISSRNGNIVAVLTTADGINFGAQTVYDRRRTPWRFRPRYRFRHRQFFLGQGDLPGIASMLFRSTLRLGSSTRIYSDPSIPAAVAPIGVSTSLNLLGGINVGAANNHFRLYDLTTNNGTPVLLATNAFPTDYDNTGTGTGAVDFGGDRVFALCANNGIIALQILPAPATPPAIATQPQSLSVNAGQNAPFTVAATGTAPLYYQWRFNGTNIPGATDSSYTRFNAQPSHAGPYSVGVSNVAGSVTSTDAVLSVILPAPAHIDLISIALIHGSICKLPQLPDITALTVRRTSLTGPN
jgi:hypothetical protein